MAITFEQTWRTVLAHAPLAGPLLCREWVQWAYNEFAISRDWSDLRVESVIAVNVQRTGTATVTLASATVAGGTLVFTAADVGRQFRLGSIPIYTIISVSLVGGTSAVLDRVYQEPSGVVTGYVLDAYVTMPLDFERFTAVLDPANRWKLRWWISADYLNGIDPGRTATSNPAILVNQKYSPVLANLGQPRFELYPYQTGARAYSMWYIKKGPILADDDPFIGMLANRAKDVLVDGALSRCAMWPGATKQEPNPYFNLGLAKAHEASFRDKISALSGKDDDLYFEDCPVAEFPYAPFPWDSAYLQSHEPMTVG